MNNEKLILETLKVLLCPKIFSDDYKIELGTKIEKALTPKVNDLRKRNEKALNKFSFKGEIK